ncbi:MAG: ATP-binding protein [Eubacteriales bacterium]|nr:ATP-binding protein [Eubacteriales bacterium]
MEKYNNEHFLPGMGYESRWKEDGCDAVLSFPELLERISDSENSGQVILMEGPTGCGKSLMIRRLREQMPDQVVVFSAESIVDYCDWKYIPWKPGHYAGEIPEGYDIVCIEDVDFLRSTNQQTLVSVLIRELISADKTVVLNGIDCTERSPELFQNLHHLLQVFRFAEEHNSD